jgi:hypothetical protein
MSNSRPSTRSRVAYHLEILTRNAPHRPAGQRAQRFIDLAPAIEAALERAGPAETLDLLDAAIRTAAGVINTGLLPAEDHADLRRVVMRSLEKNIARLGSTELTQFIDRVAPLLRADRCGFVMLITPILPRLTKSQLKRLDQALRKTPVPASDPFHAPAHRDRLHLRRQIACCAGDSALYFDIDACCAAEDPIMTARVLFFAGRAEEAMHMLDRGMIERSVSPRSDRLRADILSSRGETEMAQNLRLSCFHRDLCAEALRDYLRQAPDFDDIIAEEEALAYATAFPEPRRTVRFFLRYGRPDLAAERVLAEAHTWSAVDTWDQDDAAAGLAPHHPLAASVLLRGLVIRILMERDRAMFRQARRHLKQLSAIAAIADADACRPARYEPHAVWLAGLRERMFSSGFLRPRV